MTAMVDIAHFYNLIKSEGLAFTPTLVYIISRAANDIKQFRWRIRNNAIVEHELVHPSFTIETTTSDVFGFCYVDFEINARNFIGRAEDRMAALRAEPVFEDEQDRDDYLFLSANPWIHFTSMEHAMHYHPTDSIPRVVWGKYVKKGGRLELPVSVQVHHATVDGRHVGAYFDKLQVYFNSDDWLNE